MSSLRKQRVVMKASTKKSSRSVSIQGAIASLIHFKTPRWTSKGSGISYRGRPQSCKAVLVRPWDSHMSYSQTLAARKRDNLLWRNSKWWYWAVPPITVERWVTCRAQKQAFRMAVVESQGSTNLWSQDCLKSSSSMRGTTLASWRLWWRMISSLTSSTSIQTAT